MKNRKRKCSSCICWIKLKQFIGPATGLCEHHDLRCSSGYTCNDWVGTKIPTRER